MGSDRIISRASCGGNLSPVPATSIFDCAIERWRLALLRDCSELGALGSRVKQAYYADKSPMSPSLGVKTRLLKIDEVYA